MKRFKTVVALMLCAVMVISVFPAYSQDAGNSDAETEMTGSSVNPWEIAEVETNDKGIYTVTITERNLIYDESLAELIPEIVAADEADKAEISRGDLDDWDDFWADEWDYESIAEDNEDDNDVSPLDDDGDVFEGDNDDALIVDEDPEYVTEAEEAAEPVAETGEGEETETVSGTASEEKDIETMTESEKEEAETTAESEKENPEVTAESDKEEPETVTASEKEEAETMEETEEEPLEELTEGEEETIEELTEEETEENGWSHAEVATEDLSVFCNIPQTVSEGEEPRYKTKVTRIGNVNHNDDGSLTFSFIGEAEAADVRLYTVRFAEADAYAVVQVNSADNGFEIKDIDYEELEAELTEGPGLDFDENDVVLPEGTYIEDGELIVTDAAPEAVLEVLVDSGIAEVELSRNLVDNTDSDAKDSGGNTEDDSDNATLKYIQEFNARQKSWQNYDAVADYSPEILGYINPTAGKVAGFGADVYRIFKGFYTNNWGSGIEGTLGVLKLFGLFGGGGSAGVSNAQILSEVQKVGLEVSDLHSLTRVMNETANITLAELYKERIEAFDTAIIAMNANAEIAQKMLTQGAILASERGIYVPGENATAEEEFEFNFDLIELIEGEEAGGGKNARPFKGFTKYMDAVEDNFILVAGALAKSSDFNPVTAYDAYWNMYFNYDTQGYYLRQAYRSNIEYELKRAFCLIEIYRNIFAPETLGNYSDHNTRLVLALEQLSKMSAGTSPEDVPNGGSDSFRTSVYCNTFEKRITGITVGYSCAGNDVATGIMEEYVRRLHGRTVDEDLKLAGMWRDSNSTGWRLKWDSGGYTNCAHGIGLNAKKDGSWYKADIIALNGSIQKAHKTYGNMDSFSCYDDGTNWRMPYIWFWFG